LCTFAQDVLPLEEEHHTAVEESQAPQEEQAATEIEVPEEEEPVVIESSEPAPKWYFTFKPGYFYFTDTSMREFYNTGGFSMRGEAGCRVWGPLIVWMDGGYFQKDGVAIGGDEKHKIMLGTITLGLKAIHYFHDAVAIYGGAGPRLFIAVIHNGSPYVSGVDTGVGIGGGFSGGVWVFPFFKCKNAARNIYLDFFADYSLKTLKIDADEISSEDFDVNVSGVTAGLGIGIRF
jgi:hypothetical protein